MLCPIHSIVGIPGIVDGLTDTIVGDYSVTIVHLLRR